MQYLVDLLSPVTSRIGIPDELIPLALIRPLSGSGALGMLAAIIKAHGPDSLTGLIASTMQGSTETTFYVLTVYFGAVGVRKIRHSLPARPCIGLSWILGVHLYRLPGFWPVAA